MPVLGIGMTEQDPEHTWAEVKPTIHPHDTLILLALRAWRLYAHMLDTGEDRDRIEQVARTAEELQKLALEGAECKCVLPEQSCAVCRLTARVINEDMPY